MVNTFGLSQESLIAYPPSETVTPNPRATGNQILGERYEVLQRLSRRHRRLTFLAQDLETQAPVIIKLLAFNQETQWNEFNAFKQTAATLPRLSHPAIPPYLEHFEVELRNGSRGVAIVQSYQSARSLQSYLQEGRVFSEAEVRKIARAVLQALAYLHQLEPRELHRDLKPDNILVLESLEQVFLINLTGVEEFAQDGPTFDTSTIGTFGFMAPEQFSGRLLPASDLYSLGITLIALLTGVPPTQLPRKNLRVRFEDIAPTTPAFTDWLQWMTEPLVENRLASAETALQALEQEILRQPLPSKKVGLPKPPECRAVLHKTLSSCEVILPAAGFTPVIQAFMGASLGLLAGSLTGLGFALHGSGLSSLLALLMLPPLAIGLVTFLAALATAKGRIRLRLSHRHISLIYELFRWKVAYPPTVAIRQVSKLRLRKQREGNEAKVHPKLILQAKQYRYEFGTTLLFDWAKRLWLTNNPQGFSTLSAADLEWLAQELSQWLGLPISD